MTLVEIVLARVHQLPNSNYFILTNRKLLKEKQQKTFLCLHLKTFRKDGLIPKIVGTMS